MNARVVVRPRWAQMVAWAALAVGLFAVGLVWFEDGIGSALRTFGLPAAGVFFCVWVWSWPEMAIDNDGVLVRNSLKTTFIPWRDFRSAEVRLGMLIRYRTDGKDKQVYTSAVPSRARLKRTSELPRIDLHSSGEVVLHLEAPAAAGLLTEAHLSSTGRRGAARTHWNGVLVAIQVGLLLWGVFGLSTG